MEISFFFFFSSRRRHTRLTCDWSSDVCSSDLALMWRMTGESVLAAVLATIALGILLRGAMILVFGTQTQYPLRDLGWTNASVPVGDARISAAGLALILATAAVYGGLFAF